MRSGHLDSRSCARHRAVHRGAALVLASMLALAACGTDADPGSSSTEALPGTSQDANVRLDQRLDELADSDFSGAVLVSDHGEVTARGFGFADREDSVPNRPDTAYDIGSLTKQFTGAAILRLQMDGQLSTDDHVGLYLSDLPPDKGVLTLHQLLTHTAGLPDALGSDEDAIDRDAYLDRVATAPLLHEPGTSYAYSNVGYSILAAVVEEVSGKPYEAYLHDALFDPAGMTATGYLMADWGPDDVAVGYRGDTAVGRPQEMGWDDDGPSWHLVGNGGIVSTAEDMLRWHEALEGDAVLDTAAKESYYGRHTPEGAGADTFYGYGWALFPLPDDAWLVTHNGGNGIFFADMLRFLDDDVVVFVATNDAGTADEDLAFDLAATVLGDDVLASPEQPGCGVGVPGAAALAELEPLDSDDVAAPALVARETVELLVDPSVTDEERRTFVDERIGGSLAAELSPDELDAGIGELRDELADLGAPRLLREDDVRFHAVFGDDDDQPSAVLSLLVGDDEPRRLTCLEIEVYD